MSTVTAKGALPRLASAAYSEDNPRKRIISRMEIPARGWPLFSGGSSLDRIMYKEMANKIVTIWKPSPWAIGCFSNDKNDPLGISFDVCRYKNVHRNVLSIYFHCISYRLFLLCFYEIEGIIIPTPSINYETRLNWQLLYHIRLWYTSWQHIDNRLLVTFQFNPPKG
jgi:hypothetical protein